MISFFKKPTFIETNSFKQVQVVALVLLLLYNSQNWVQVSALLDVNLRT